MWRQTKKNDDQEVFRLNAWEFAMLWEVKLLPATAQAIERLTQRSSRASPKKIFLVLFWLAFLLGSAPDRVRAVFW